MSRDLVYDADGKPYAKARRTPAQQAEQGKRDRAYWAWVDAKMSKSFVGTLDEYKASQTPLAERTRKALMPMATALKIRGRWRMRKAALVEAIERGGGSIPLPVRSCGS